MIKGLSPDLPHTHHLPAAKEWGLRLVRPVAAVVLRVCWRIQLHGADRVPSSGPVILAANHIGWLDGPVLVATTRRLTFALGKHELFVGLGGWLLTQIGQISVNRHELDPRAIRRAVQVLRADRVLTVFPEGVRRDGLVDSAQGGTAYLAMVTGATVVPVAILGTREAGQTRSQAPHFRRPIHVVFGEPIAVDQVPWPRRKQPVAALTEDLRLRLVEHVVAAQRLTGLPLPGPPRPVPAAVSPPLPSVGRPVVPRSRVKQP